MRGGDLVREARLRAGITQAVLAKRLRTSQAAVARWEARHASPSLERVQEAVEACGFAFVVRMPPLDRTEIDLAIENLRLTPSQRMEKYLQIVDLSEDLVAGGMSGDQAWATARLKLRPRWNRIASRNHTNRRRKK